MHISKKHLALVTGLLLVILSGCGQSSSTAKDSSSATSSSQHVKKPAKTSSSSKSSATSSSESSVSSESSSESQQSSATSSSESVVSSSSSQPAQASSSSQNTVKVTNGDQAVAVLKAAQQTAWENKVGGPLVFGYVQMVTVQGQQAYRVDIGKDNGRSTVASYAVLPDGQVVLMQQY
ncbi:hypothetical protein [Lacticaseibacillus saniviri]|uniref:PepSY domain-containing protein n=1 Tax=Lacticaseibacillus saniviri JCM 17471 = DSM 24301 TaxID=1293598 RepID=A0A0R2MXW0_9LACO|nr:hypothetical protein [Lacticaseibacillus saniviri]KRO17708.1 hypothetical protein IV56_GL002194 [Lacticaseibacillus saniviri JCM 17471 = DSM 24301]MCG4281108.1 hypothetical protein [Lacticaseibacillus saniviri]